MTRQDIMRDIERQYGAFPTKNQLRQYIRCRPAYIDELMEGIDPLLKGDRATRYFAGDVATRIVESVR